MRSGDETRALEVLGFYSFAPTHTTPCLFMPTCPMFCLCYTSCPLFCKLVYRYRDVPIMLTENHCNMYYTIHFTIAIASSYATSADAVDDSLGREGENGWGSQ